MSAQPMPAVFIGHGSPMNAIEENEFHLAWVDAAKGWPRPEAVLCVSAHWETEGALTTGAAAPETLYDFSGFPEPLYEVRYRAPGHPKLAARVAKLVGGAVEGARGLDHGAWSVLRAMYPAADVPVVQLSMDTAEAASKHAALARALAPLRDEGVLVLGSGNMVHNLGVMRWRETGGFPWAERIAAAMRKRLVAGDLAALADYVSLDPEIRLAIPTPEHYLPALYVLAQRRDGEPVAVFNDKCVMGSISMTSFRIG